MRRRVCRKVDTTKPSLVKMVKWQLDTTIKISYNDHLSFRTHWKKDRPYILLCPQRNFRRHSNRTVRPSVPLRVRCISPIFFEVGIPNLMYGCILGWRSVAQLIWVAVTLSLTSDLFFRIIVTGAYLLYYLR